MEYAISQGFDVQNADKDIKAYRIKDYGGLHIFKNGGYHCFSSDEKGSIIDFAKNYQNLSFVEAVANIIGESPHEHRLDDYTPKKSFTKSPISNYKQEKSEVKKEMVLPQKDASTKDIVDYLVNKRFLDKDIVNELIENGSIFQAITTKGDYTFKNCAFVGFDKENKPKYCSLRSIYEKSSFRQDVLNSDKNYGFAIKGESHRLFTFESPIDSISHATIRKLNNIDHTKDSRISCGGLNDKAITKFLEENKNIKEIVFCFDNDRDGKDGKNQPFNQGQEFSKKCYHKFKELGYKTYVETPQNKDFNMDLSIIHEGIQRVRNERLKKLSENEKDEQIFTNKGKIAL